MERYICIHGHFYQPPRENPWLEAVELQDSAYPYHDWNERITAECYAPNSCARILDADSRIAKIVNNYSRISFNFGPTLLAWLAEKSPDVFGDIIAADRESQARFSGHGSAMAQAYNHMILPLANSRDKRTQILWGLRDFETRFGRRAEGMWLPETAVDCETLEILAECGVKFTVLSPYQAKRARAFRARVFRDVSGGRIDPSMAYRVPLPSGRNISVFFYDGPISQAVAFEKLLSNGEAFARRLVDSFSPDRTWPQLAHIASDGETYGHHQRHGDMALAYALDYIERQGLAKLTNYGEYLEKHPPNHDAQIWEDSSWSCVHGVERWKSSCGCNTGGNAGWNQLWRGPLRESLDWLRDRLAEQFQKQGSEIYKDPWKARDNYIDVILDRSRNCVDDFFATHLRRELTQEERTRALKLMELQRHAMLMYTSCGWFFDELSGIETVQVIQYAGRALQLAEQLGGTPLEEPFLQRLERAQSNIPGQGDGRQIYDRYVKPAAVDLDKVAGHYAVSALFDDYGEKSRIYCYDALRQGECRLQDGKRRLAIGKLDITSRITENHGAFSFASVHLGDGNVIGAIRRLEGEDGFEVLTDEVTKAFRAGDFPELIRTIDKAFQKQQYTLKSLFRDEQRRISGMMLEAALSEAGTLYRSLYGQYGTLARHLAALGIPLPVRFQKAVEFTLNEDLLAAFSVDTPDPQRVADLLHQVKESDVPLDTVSLEFRFRKSLDRIASEFRAEPERIDTLRRFEQVASIAPRLPFETDMWVEQNIFFKVFKEVAEKFESRALEGDEDAAAWMELSQKLADTLRFSLPFTVRN